MRTTRTIWAGLLAAVCITSATWANDVPTLQKIYTAERAKLKQNYIDTLQAAPETYLQGLTALESKHQKSGNLKEVLLARKEKLRFTEKKSLPSPLSSDPEIRALQTTFQNTKDAAANKTRESFVALSDKYLERLEQLKRSLTSQNKIEEAITAQDEIDRVNADPKLIDARKHLGTQQATSNPSTPDTANSHDPEKTCPGVKIFTGDTRPSSAPRYTRVPANNTGLAAGNALSVSLGKTRNINQENKEYLQLNLRPTLRNAFTDTRIVVQYFDAGEVSTAHSGFRKQDSDLKRMSGSGKKVVTPELRTTHHIYGVDIPVRGAIIDCPGTEGTGKLHGAIASVYDSEGKLIAQMATPASLRSHAQKDVLDPEL